MIASIHWLIEDATYGLGVTGYQQIYTIMNYASTYSFLLICLLASCTGCQKEPEQLSSGPQNGCLIATQMTKELVRPGQTSQLDLETVTVDRKSFRVSTTKKSAYTYDEQGRILTEYNQYADNKADSVFYTYTADSVLISRINIMVSPRVVSTAKVKLNNLGYAENQPYSRKATYDKDGYLTHLESDEGSSIIYKVLNGNVIESSFSDSPATPTHIIKTQFDLTRPGIPTVPTFYGKVSRNLPIKGSIDDDYWGNIIPNVYNTSYTYTFDKVGNVTRQIMHGEDGDPPFIYGGLKVIVTDFTYTCPQ